MTFQKTVRFDQGFGVVGEIRFDGPHRAAEYTLATNDADGIASENGNIIGHAFTLLDADDAGNYGRVRAGGTGVFAGILANPKVYPYRGSVAESGYADSERLYLPDGNLGEFVTMGFIVVKVEGHGKPGDFVAYDKGTGILQVLARPADGSDPTPATGTVQVPNATIDRYPTGSASTGLALIRLTN